MPEIVQIQVETMFHKMLAQKARKLFGIPSFSKGSAKKGSCGFSVDHTFEEVIHNPCFQFFDKKNVTRNKDSQFVRQKFDNERWLLEGHFSLLAVVRNDHHAGTKHSNVANA